MLKKIYYIFDGKQKRNFFFLCLLILIGGFFELFGVSAILPLVTLLANPGQTPHNVLLSSIGRFIQVFSYEQYILILTVFFILVYIVKNAYLLFMYKMQFRFAYNNQFKMGSELTRCYLTQDYSFHLNKNLAGLQRNIQNDVPAFCMVIQNLTVLAAESVTCILLFVFLLLQDFFSAMGMCLILIFFLSFFYFLYRKYSIKTGSEARNSYEESNKWLIQGLSGIKMTIISNKEAYFIEKYRTAYRRFTNAQKKQSFLSILPRPVIETVCVCILLSVITLRIYLGGNTDGILPILSVFALAAFRILPSFNRITGAINTILYGKNSVEAIYKDIQESRRLDKREKPEHGTGNERLAVTHGIFLKGVTYKYPKTEHHIFFNMHMDIPKNTSVAIVGVSGVGKTTLIDIILGVLKPESGTVFVDDKSIHDYPREWHNTVGYIPQSIYLLDDTICNNIAYGIQNPDQERIETVLKEVRLLEFVHSLPEGIHTKVGERGIRLSGGQIQRIGIARALYCDPAVLVLDEATSALDTETEKAVMDAIRHLHGTRTILIIAHRQTTIEYCDITYEVCNNGIKKIENARSMEIQK